jgi:hypothetical protein
MSAADAKPLSAKERADIKVRHAAASGTAVPPFYGVSWEQGLFLEYAWRDVARLLATLRARDEEIAYLRSLCVAAGVALDASVAVIETQAPNVHLHFSRELAKRLRALAESTPRKEDGDV